MEHQSNEITFHHHSDEADFRSRVKKTTILLSVITIIELGIGLLLYAWEGAPHFAVLMFKGAVCILSLAKAYYIVSIFMHLGDEIRNMIMTIVVPLLLFVWFIAAFLWDGNSYRNLRNDYDPYMKEKTTTLKVAPAEEHEQTSEPAHGKD